MPRKTVPTTERLLSLFLDLSASERAAALNLLTVVNRRVPAQAAAQPVGLTQADGAPKRRRKRTGLPVSDAQPSEAAN